MPITDCLELNFKNRGKMKLKLKMKVLVPIFLSVAIFLVSSPLFAGGGGGGKGVKPLCNGKSSVTYFDARGGCHRKQCISSSNPRTYCSCAGVKYCSGGSTDLACRGELCK